MMLSVKVSTKHQIAVPSDARRALGIQAGDWVLVEPAHVSDLETGAVVVVSVGTGSWFHRLNRNGSALQLESLRPGGEKTLVEDEERLANAIARGLRRYGMAVDIALDQVCAMSWRLSGR